MTWDHGGSNSYRMGAEGKYDLAMAPPELGGPPASRSGSNKQSSDKKKVSAEFIEMLPRSLL